MRAQPTASHYVNGRYIEDEGGAPLPVIYPATGETIAMLRSATPNVLELAVEAARAAQPAWARLKPVERGRILRRAADILRARNADLARIETLDTGKAIQETLVADAPSAADCLEYFGGAVAAYNGESVDLGGSFAYTRREALGVCVGIGAWNYPIQIAGWKSAPALAMGNAMVFKPSENTPLSALALAEIYSEAGLPDGLFNVVQGYGDVGAGLVGHDVVAKVSVTGSVPTGRKVLSLAGSKMKHATMELGGKSPLIVFDDADIENAIGGAMLGNFYSTGQICSNGTRVFVQSGIHDRFVERLVERTKKSASAIRSTPKPRWGRWCRKRSTTRSSAISKSASRMAPFSPAAAICPHCRVFRVVFSSSRRCSPGSPTPCASRARRSSGLS